MADRGPDAVRLDRDRFIGFAFASADLLLELDGDLLITWAGGAVRSLLRVNAEEAIGVSFAQFVARLDAVRVGATMRALQPGERHKDLFLGLMTGSGQVLPVGISVYRGLNKAKIQYFLAVTQRTPTSVTNEARPHDRTTGLIEAVEFAQSTAAALRAAHAAGQSARLTLVQICGETELGRLLGPDRSQALLSEIGTELRRHAVTADGAAKLGDGRFSVARLDDEASDVISAVIERLGENYQLDPGNLQVREASVDFGGGSLAEADVESILSHVLERFRTEGANGFDGGSAEDYLRKMMAETVSRVVMMRDLIHERKLSLHYQPIVALTDRKVHHYEVLLRFPDGRSPFEDIVFAEQINTIHEVDLAVARGAIARLQEAEAKKQPLSLAVNMSARSLLNDTFLSMFEELADKVGGNRANLIIEITESAKLVDLAKAAEAVSRLGARGHPVCLDDFGAGAASLPYLQRLIVRYVKIDGAYVRGIDDHLRERAIIEGVLATCKSLDVLTVAEMVEREDEHKVLARLGVNLGQGWLYGRPASQIPGASGLATVRVPRKLDPKSIDRLLTKGRP